MKLLKETYGGIKIYDAGCVRCNPTGTIRKIENMFVEFEDDGRFWLEEGTGTISVSEIMISERTPNSALETLESIGLYEVDSLRTALTTSSKKVFIKTASLGGKARFYADEKESGYLRFRDDEPQIWCDYDEYWLPAGEHNGRYQAMCDKCHVLHTVSI